MNKIKIIRNEDDYNNKKEKKNKNFDIICKCPHYKYNSKSFIDFIEDEKNDKINIYSDVDIIAVSFTSSTLNYPIPCKLNDKFSFIENKFYNECPQYKNKKCFFTANGQRLKPEQTLSENSIRNGDTILTNCSEF